MRLKKLTALLLIVLLLVPAAAFAKEMTASESAKAACIAANGELLKEPYAVFMDSPYGTQSVVLRDVPSDSYGAVAMLMVGQEMTVIGEAEGFFFVLLDEEVFGWLAEDEVKLKD